MKTPIQIYRELRQRFPEIYFRLAHAKKIFQKRFPSVAVEGRIELPSEFQFDEINSVNRGYKAPDGRYFSRINKLFWDDIPLSVKYAIKNYDSVLRLYLGDGYLVSDANLWRNYSIPGMYRNMELFSQHWHYDKVVDYRNIQLFVLLGNVTTDDGPFEYVFEPDEKNLLASVFRRNNADLELKTKKLIGARGDTFLFSTGSTPHRAGIPADGHTRDIFSIAFFPAYTKIGISSELLLKNLD